MKFIVISIIMLTLTLIVNPAYSIVQTYNIELHCPIDSFDFVGTFVEFDYIEMCELTGVIQNPDNVFGYGDVTPILNDTQFEELLLRIQQDKPQTKTLRQQLDERFDSQKQELLEEFENFLVKNGILKQKLSTVKADLEQLINILKLKLAEIKKNIEKSNDNINPDDLITDEELDRILKNALSKSSILPPAYGDTFVFKDKVNELIELSKENTKLQKDNKKLEDAIKKIEQSKKDVLKKQVEIDNILKQLKIKVNEAVEKIKKEVKDSKIGEASESIKDKIKYALKDWLN